MGVARERTLALVAPLDDEQLTRVHSPIMSPLAWDLGHIAAYEDLWLAHRCGGMELLRPELAQLYDAFETPRAIRGEIDALGPAAAKRYMADVRARTTQLLCERGADELVCEMVLRHELQHTETMRQTMALAGLLCSDDLARLHEPLGEPPREASHDAPRGAPDGLGAPAPAPATAPEWLELPAGTFAMGAPAEGFAYDNERPRHEVELPAFALSLRPVTNASWARFGEDGGYQRREWWSPEGWAWQREHALTAHPSVSAAHPDAPVCHVSWFEADAYARSRGARLPSEAEWERAASHAGARRLEGVGRVWEWTASRLYGYPGFVAHPYREYSEVFFGEDYRVLRGGSWATHPRVGTLTFRNWDRPQRRQIFAGVRLARDA